MTTDHIVIIGGGLVGSSIAYHLCSRHHPAPAVTVIERDPSYHRASSYLAMGGIRQQFSSAANIRFAQHSIDFYKGFDDKLAASKTDIRVNFQQRGYLFLVNAAMAKRFEQRYTLQKQLGASIERLNVETIHAHAPDLKLDDIVFGLFGPEDGYAHSKAALSGFRHLAITAGATYRTATVTGFITEHGRVRGVRLDTGASIAAQAIVCAVGAFTKPLAALAGIDLPITPVRQHLFRCGLPCSWSYRFPMVIDPSGVHWRHEDPRQPGDQDRIVVAYTKLDEPPGENFACDIQRWNSEFQPALIARLPALADSVLVEGWSGLYSMTPDHNPILGEYPKQSGFYVATGFSGHGLMMAPATGQAMADLLTTGTSNMLDIRAFDPERFTRGELFWDDAMI